MNDGSKEGMTMVCQCSMHCLFETVCLFVLFSVNETVTSDFFLSLLFLSSVMNSFVFVRCSVVLVFSPL